MPVTPVPIAASVKPSSSDHGSTPMMRKRGSPVVGSIRTRSIAPGVARWPALIWAPSKAGPVGLDAARTRPRPANTISALVPTSTTSRTRSRSGGEGVGWSPASSSAVRPRPVDRTTAAVSAPTWPAMQGSTWARVAGCASMSREDTGRSSGPSTARANGAPPSGVGS